MGTMKTLLPGGMLLLLLLSGCPKDNPVVPHADQPPKTFLWLFPDSTIAQGTSKQHIRWWGEDPDGIVVGYLFVSGKSLLGNAPISDTLTWTWKTTNDTIIAFPLLVRRDTFDVAVRAVDNTFPVRPPDGAKIRFSPQPYWDKDTNGIFDAGDVPLPALPGAADPKGASLGFPLLNQPPSVTFALNPIDQVTPMQQPETTYTAATFAWIGTDPDGDNTIVGYRIALNNPSDSTSWVNVGGNVSIVSLYVPRSRSDTSSGTVTADLYTGRFLNRQYVGSVPGLKLDTLNTFYLQAKDIAGDVSPIIRMPSGSFTWFVRRPRSRLLTVIDYINSDSARADDVYHRAFAGVQSGGKTLADYDELNIGRGISPTDKQNAAAGQATPAFGALVPPFIDPAFIYTLYLYDAVFWYTDQFPSIPVARASLFQYTTTSFDNHKGKVIFTTSFGTTPDPRGLLRDFAPIDSVSSVSLDSRRLLPTFGDTRLPAGYQLYPDSLTPGSMYPPLAITTTQSFQLVSMRPIFRRPDASYIYRIQPDTRNPLRYVYLTTLAELRAAAAVNNLGWACGASGVILRTTDLGSSWVPANSGATGNLNALQFLDQSTGWCVGDSGAVYQSTDGGATWSNHSLLTFESLLGLRFASASIGVAVGTEGLIIRTTNGGTGWASVRSGTGKNLRSVSFVDAQTGTAVGDSGTIVRTTDGGASWTLLQPVTGADLKSVSLQGDGTGIATGASGVVLRSTDSGASWSLLTQLPMAEARCVTFSDVGNGWICGMQNRLPFPDNGIIFHSTDGGATWTQQTSGLIYPTTNGQILDGIAFSGSSVGWAVGTGGIIIGTQSGGVTWGIQPGGNLNVAVIDGAKSFVFLGLPLHIFGDAGNVTGVQQFLQRALLDFGL